MAFNLNAWLRKTPQPVAVMADDKRIEVPKNGRAWRDLTASIEALEPSKLTCLDGQGNVIRAKVLESESGEEEKSTELASDLQTLSKLLADAYDRGSRATQPLLDNALAMIERQATHIAKQEQALERYRNESVRLRAQLAAAEIELDSIPELPEGQEDGGIVGALMQGVIAGQQQKAASNVRPMKKKAAPHSEGE